MTQSTLLVDQSHLGRTVTGLERITLELFSAEALAPLRPEAVPPGGSVPRMMFAQQVTVPARLAADRHAILLAPGFPPSIPAVLLAARRIVPYVHDCFLIDRPQDLNWRARHYMAPAFRFALARCPWLLVNSEATRDEVRRHARPDADVTLYRPRVRDVFAVGPDAAAALEARVLRPGGRLDVISVGTIEPRKNLSAAVAIVQALRRRHGFDAILHLVGRPGWGGEAERLGAEEGVRLHGYLEPDAVRRLLLDAHLFLSTSHDEGLGLPLIEAQYAGLPVVAPEKAVFREVLGASGLHVDTADPVASADRIAARLSEADVFTAAAASAAANVERWNRSAATDRTRLIDRLARRLART